MTVGDGNPCAAMHALVAWAWLSAPPLACASATLTADTPSVGYMLAKPQPASRHPRRKALPASYGLLADVLPALVGSMLLRGTDATPDSSLGSTLSLVDSEGAQLVGPSQPTATPLSSGNFGQLTLSPLTVAAAAALMLLCGAVSVQLSLGLHKTIALATLRCSHHHSLNTLHW